MHPGLEGNRLVTFIFRVTGCPGLAFPAGRGASFRLSAREEQEGKNRCRWQ